METPVDPIKSMCAPSLFDLPICPLLFARVERHPTSSRHLKAQVLGTKDPKGKTRATRVSSQSSCLAETMQTWTCTAAVCVSITNVVHAMKRPMEQSARVVGTFVAAKGALPRTQRRTMIAKRSDRKTASAHWHRLQS